MSEFVPSYEASGWYGIAAPKGDGVRAGLCQSCSGIDSYVLLRMYKFCLTKSPGGS